MNLFLESCRGLWHKKQGQNSMDSVHVSTLSPELTVLLVSDGVSSQPGSERLSHLACAMLPTLLLLALMKQKTPVTSMSDYVPLVNWAVKQTALQLRQSLRGEPLLAATLTGALVRSDGAVLVFWLGDSPSMLMKKDRLLPLTFPHNVLVEELGLLAEEEICSDAVWQTEEINSQARHNAHEQAVIRFLSNSDECGEEQERLSFTQTRMEHDDLLLLGSDGVMQFVGEDCFSVERSAQGVGKFAMEQSESRTGDDRTLIVLHRS